jgi:hypothetical protein
MTLRENVRKIAEANGFTLDNELSEMLRMYETDSFVRWRERVVHRAHAEYAEGDNAFTLIDTRIGGGDDVEMERPTLRALKKWFEQNGSNA